MTNDRGVPVRRLIRATMATMASLALVAPTAIPAAATPGPNRYEWWFDSFSLQTKAWPYTKGNGVTVAVLDTGVNAELPDFRGGVVLPGANFNGGGGDGRKDHDDSDGHGTSMASLIAAQGTGPSGFVGVAPGAKILPIEIQINGDGRTEAIRYAVDHGAKVINISQGGPSGDPAKVCPSDIQDAVAYAAKHDVVVLAASGNSGDAGNAPEYPAGCAGVVAVGAFDRTGKPWVSTDRQSFVTVGGPGVQIASIGKDGRLYVGGNGTSQATAIVSGEVALLRAKFPDESARQIVQRIIATATDLGPKGKDDTTGYGGVSLRKAMTATVPSNAPNPVYDRLDKVIAAQKKSKGDNAQPSTSSKKNSSGSGMLFVIAGLIALVVIVIVIFLVVRNRKGGPPPSGQSPYTSGYGQQQGPPPSFGPPPGQGPQNQGRYDQGLPPGGYAPPNQGPPPESYR